MNVNAGKCPVNIQDCSRTVPGNVQDIYLEFSDFYKDFLSLLLHVEGFSGRPEVRLQ